MAGCAGTSCRPGASCTPTCHRAGSWQSPSTRPASTGSSNNPDVVCGVARRAGGEQRNRLDDGRHACHGRRPAIVPATLGVDALVLGGRRITGASVGIALIDSGIAPTGGYVISDFVDFVNARRLPYDDFGHGTHLAGLIAGNGLQSNGQYRGVAPGAHLVGLKVLDANGTGHTSTVIAAIDYVVKHQKRLDLDVINLSLGHVIYEPAATDPLVQAVERAVAAGLVVVVSAGNIGINPTTGAVGYSGITSPGNARSAITVGALDTRQTLTRTDDVVTDYSSRGPTWHDGLAKPDLVAPGHHLTSDATSTSTLSIQLASRYTATAGPLCLTCAAVAPERHEHGGGGDQRGRGPDDRRPSRQRGAPVAQCREGRAGIHGLRRARRQSAGPGRWRPQRGGRDHAGGRPSIRASPLARGGSPRRPTRAPSSALTRLPGPNGSCGATA